MGRTPRRVSTTFTGRADGKTRAARSSRSAAASPSAAGGPAFAASESTSSAPSRRPPPASGLRWMPGACTTRWSGWAGRAVTARKPGTRPTGMTTRRGSRNACVAGPTQTRNDWATISVSSPTAGATRPGGGEEAPDQARRVEPSVSGVEGDLPDMVGNGQAALEAGGALSSDPLRGVAPAREPADAVTELALLIGPFGPFERTTIVVAGIAPELTR